MLVSNIVYFISYAQVYHHAYIRPRCNSTRGYMDLFGLRKALQAECSSVREELDDHLEAINENARDAAEVREVLGSLDDKIEKLSARIDELYLLLGAEATLSEREAQLQQFLRTSRSLEEVAAFCRDSVAAAERSLRTLHFKGVHVYTVVENGVSSFTTSPPAIKHISLNNYF